MQTIHQEKCAEEGEKKKRGGKEQKKKEKRLTSNTLSVKDSLL